MSETISQQDIDRLAIYQKEVDKAKLEVEKLSKALLTLVTDSKRVSDTLKVTADAMKKLSDVTTKGFDSIQSKTIKLINSLAKLYKITALTFTLMINVTSKAGKDIDISKEVDKSAKSIDSLSKAIEKMSKASKVEVVDSQSEEIKLTQVFDKMTDSGAKAVSAIFGEMDKLKIKVKKGLNDFGGTAVNATKDFALAQLSDLGSSSKDFLLKGAIDSTDAAKDYIKKEFAKEVSAKWKLGYDNSALQKSIGAVSKSLKKATTKLSQKTGQIMLKGLKLMTGPIGMGIAAIFAAATVVSIWMKAIKVTDGDKTYFNMELKKLQDEANKNPLELKVLLDYNEKKAELDEAAAKQKVGEKFVEQYGAVDNISKSMALNYQENNKNPELLKQYEDVEENFKGKDKKDTVDDFLGNVDNLLNGLDDLKKNTQISMKSIEGDLKTIDEAKDALTAAIKVAPSLEIDTKELEAKLEDLIIIEANTNVKKFDIGQTVQKEKTRLNKEFDLDQAGSGLDKAKVNLDYARQEVGYIEEQIRGLFELQASTNDENAKKVYEQAIARKKLELKSVKEALDTAVDNFEGLEEIENKKKEVEEFKESLSSLVDTENEGIKLLDISSLEKEGIDYKEKLLSLKEGLVESYSEKLIDAEKLGLKDEEIEEIRKNLNRVKNEVVGLKGEMINVESDNIISSLQSSIENLSFDGLGKGTIEYVKESLSLHESALSDLKAKYEEGLEQGMAAEELENIKKKYEEVANEAKRLKDELKTLEFEKRLDGIFDTKNSSFELLKLDGLEEGTLKYKQESLAIHEETLSQIRAKYEEGIELNLSTEQLDEVKAKYEEVKVEAEKLKDEIKIAEFEGVKNSYEIDKQMLGVGKTNESASSEFAKEADGKSDNKLIAEIDLRKQQIESIMALYRDGLEGGLSESSEVMNNYKTEMEELGKEINSLEEEQNSRKPSAGDVAIENMANSIIGPFEAFATGGPIAGFVSMLTQSETFSKILEKVSELFMMIADTVGLIFEPFADFLTGVVTTLQPAFEFIGNLINKLSSFSPLGIFSSLLGFGSEKDNEAAKKTTEESEKFYSEQVDKLDEIAKNTADMNKGFGSLREKLIGNISKMPTSKRINAGQNAMNSAAEALRKQRNFGDVTLKYQEKQTYRKWFKKKTRTQMKTQTITQDQLGKAVGVDLNTAGIEELKLASSRLKNLNVGGMISREDHGGKWYKGKGDWKFDGFKGSNIDQMVGNLDQYIKQLEEAEAQAKKFEKDVKLSTLQGVKVIDAEKERATLVEAYKEAGVEITPEIEKDIDELVAQKGDYQVTVAEDFRSAIMGAKGDIGGALGGYLNTALNNAFTLSMDSLFEADYAKLEDAFKNFTDGLLEGKTDVKEIAKVSIDVLRKEKEAKKEYEASMKLLREELRNQGITDDELERLGLLEESVQKTRDTMRGLLKDAMSAAVEANSFDAFNESLGKGIYNSVKESLLQAFMETASYKEYIDNLVDSEEFKAKIEGLSPKEAFDLIQRELAGVESKLEGDGYGWNSTSATSGDAEMTNAAGVQIANESKGGNIVNKHFNYTPQYNDQVVYTNTEPESLFDKFQDYIQSTDRSYS